MLDFERELVAALTTTADPGVRTGVARVVESSLADMPDVLRLGVLVQSLLFGALARLRRGAAEDHAAALERMPIPMARQYVRLFRSLVVFAEHELAPA